MHSSIFERFIFLLCSLFQRDSQEDFSASHDREAFSITFSFVAPEKMVQVFDAREGSYL